LKKNRLLIVLLAAVAVVGVASAAVLTLWQRPMSMLITNEGVTAAIYSRYDYLPDEGSGVTPTLPLLISNTIQSNDYPENNTIGLVYGSATQYFVLIDLYSVTPSTLTTLTLNVTDTDVPAYLNVTIDSINLMTVQYIAAHDWGIVSNNYIVAQGSNIPLNSAIPTTVSQALYENGLTGQYGYDERVGIIVYINAVQIGTTTDTTATIHPTFSLTA